MRFKHTTNHADSEHYNCGELVKVGGLHEPTCSNRQSPCTPKSDIDCAQPIARGMLIASYARNAMDTLPCATHMHAGEPTNNQPQCLLSRFRRRIYFLISMWFSCSCWKDEFWIQRWGFHRPSGYGMEGELTARCLHRWHGS